MIFIEIILSLLGTLPVSNLGESMPRSKTLTAMVIIGLALYSFYSTWQEFNNANLAYNH